MKSIKPVGIALLPLLFASGCGSPDRGAQEAADEPATEESGLSALAPEGLERLMSEYAVLREDPAPQPRPESGETAIQGQLPANLPPSARQAVEGEATFYADSFEGRRTASGIPFRQNQYVAAHRAFPFGTLLRVTNLSNDRSVNVRVVDRGPHGSRAQARNTIIDLSRRAAESLGYTAQGRTQVRVEVLEWGEGIPQAS